MKTEQLIELVRDYARPEDVQRLIQVQIVDHWIKWGVCVVLVVLLAVAVCALYKLCTKDYL